MNNTTSQVDKKGEAAYPDWLIEGFNEALSETGLSDIDIVGHHYTRERGRNTDRWMEIRLDRMLEKNSWLSHFLLAKIYNLEGSPSNHCPLLLEPLPQSKVYRKNDFGLKMLV